MTTAHQVMLLENAVREARDVLRSLQDELHKARAELADIHVGDVVCAHLRGPSSPVVELRVTSIDTSSRAKPWLRGVTRKKDGEWGTQERHVFNDWEKP